MSLWRWALLVVAWMMLDAWCIQAAAPYNSAIRVPTVLTPTSTSATSDYYTMSISSSTQQLAATGAATPIWGFNGIWPGPTIIATRGRTAVITRYNYLSVPVTIHAHGLITPPDSDGHPTDFIQPGSYKIYQYPNLQPGATYWYHDHAMNATGRNVYMGLAGIYIIHDPAEDALNLPSGSFDIPLVMQDRTLNADNTLNYTITMNFLQSGFLGATMFVNGVQTPYLAVSTRKYRFRLLNGCNSRDLVLALSDGTSLTQIGSDGGLLTAPVSRATIPISSGERIDIVIDFSIYSVGNVVNLINSDTSAPLITSVMQFSITTAATSDPSSLPTILATIPPLSPSSAIATRTWSLDLLGTMWAINNLLYDPNRADATPEQDSVEIWDVVNESSEPHPFHVHAIQMQVLEINGNPPGAGNTGWKDTVSVDNFGGSLKLIMRFPPYLGLYVFHCHKLEHEDMGMMLQVNISVPGTVNVTTATATATTSILPSDGATTLIVSTGGGGGGGHKTPGWAIAVYVVAPLFFAAAVLVLAAVVYWKFVLPNRSSRIKPTSRLSRGMQYAPVQNEDL